MKNWQKLTLLGLALIAVVGGTRAAGLWGNSGNNNDKTLRFFITNTIKWVRFSDNY